MWLWSAEILLVAFLASCGVNTTNSTSKLSPQYRLEQHLLNNYPEDGRTTHPQQYTRVNVSLKIYSLFGLSENEVMEINGWATVSWMDPRLAWNSSQWPSVRSIYLPASEVWKPDIGIANSKQIESKDFSSKSKLVVEIFPSGEVMYFGYFLSETPCPINTARFPFDMQDCPLVISTVYSRVTQFQFNVTSVTMLPVSKDTVSQWEFVTFKQEAGYFAEDYRGFETTFELMRVRMILKRKPLYHIVMVIIPYCLICLVGAIMFVITDPTERFGISLSILLAMSVYFMIVSQGAPKSMVRLSILDIFMLVQMSLLVALTFVIVILPNLLMKVDAKAPLNGDSEAGISLPTRRRSKYHPIPPWRRRCDFIWLGVYLVSSFTNGFVTLGVMRSSIPAYYGT